MTAEQHGGLAAFHNKELSSTCPYCGRQSHFFVSSTDYNRYTTEDEFHYFQCERCGLIHMDPVPTDMRPFYVGGYEPIPESLKALRQIASKERYRLEPILRYKQGGKLLEIGPWRGVFCVNAKEAGFAVTAIEMDQQCVSFLNEVVGIQALQSADPAALLSNLDEYFDVIALWHSLEHLPRPWEMIEKASARLAPGGILLVAIPNIESFEFSILKSRWRHLDSPRHLFFYPIQSLIELCAANGMKMLEIETQDALSQLLSLDTWRKWAHMRYHFPLTREPITRLMYTWARMRQMRLKGTGSGLIGVFQLAE